ncbi:MAG: hypothetical protein K2Z81_20400, partial [Cyanobacteria bacterium]|nr:hypothetical protein [Cyanobacteriota bacterium]
WYSDGHFPQTAFGEVFRVDSLGLTRRYYTTNGEVFDLVQGGQQLRVLRYEGETNHVREELHVDSFREVFPENINLSRWGPVTDRTITHDGVQMTLLDGNSAFSYPSPTRFADNRLILDGIKHKDNTINFILEDGTIFGQRSSQHLLPFDWRAWEYTRPDGAEVFHYLDGERVEFRKDGTSIETYPQEISTTLGNFMEVVRGPNSNVYWARDGSRVEVPIRGGAPVVRYGVDGRQTILDVQTVREIFPHGREREFGVIRSVEYSTDGTTNYYLDTTYAADLQTVTLLGRQRYGIDGYVLKTPPADRPTAEARYLLIRGNKIMGPELTADQLETLLNTGRLPQQ